MNLRRDMSVITKTVPGGTRQLVLFLYSWLTFHYVTAGDIQRRFRHHATLERYASPIETHDCSLAHCLVRCLSVQQCQCVSYQQTTRKCEINNVHPEQTDIPGVSGPGWIVYYTPEEELMVGAEAWQSSLHCASTAYVCGYAEKALDGNIDGNYYGESCTHTYLYQFPPFWVVKLRYPVFIHKVSIFFRTDCCTERLQNIIVEVANSNATIVAGGTECGKYPGSPPVSQRPLNITCTGPAYGQYVKILLDSDNPLELCEVVVHQH